VNIRQPVNDGVIRYFESKPHSHSAEGPEVRPPTDAELRGYKIYGTHPEIAERVWGTLAAQLTPYSRQIVFGAPSLVCAESGKIFAICLGTSYAVRVPAQALASGAAAGFTTETRYTGGATLNVRTTFGADWVFGRWSKQEEDWCAVACTPEVEQATTPLLASPVPAPAAGISHRNLFHYLLVVVSVASLASFILFFTSALHEGGATAGVRWLILAIAVLLTGVAALGGYVRRTAAPAALFFGLLLLQPTLGSLAEWSAGTEHSFNAAGIIGGIAGLLLLIRAWTTR
jgi:hypothetical protein